MKSITITLFLLSQAVAQFDEWMIAYNKTYSSIEEYEYRQYVFLDNYNFVINSKNLALNKFADLSFNEFSDQYLSTLSIDFNTDSTLYFREPPHSVDWTKKGAVTPVKNQGQCGSCWAFSATGAIEAAWFLNTSKLISLSEQQLIDCSRKMGNEGCDGGFIEDAMKYVIKNRGICSEKDYPYIASNGICKRCRSSVKISAFISVQSNNETAFLCAVAGQPVAAAVEADRNWQFYSGGILTEPCGDNINHGILIVGYTSLYWKVKNSWGADWGEQGYIRLARGHLPAGQ